MENNLRRHSTIEDFLNQRATFMELFLVAVMLSVGTGLLTNYAFTEKILDSIQLALIGIIFIFISLGILFHKKFRTLHYDVKIPCFILFNKSTKTIVPVANYIFSNTLASTLSATFLENRAFASVWNKEPLNSSKPTESQITGSEKFLIEAIEFFLIEKLSTHLTGYFDDSEEIQLALYNCNDLPDLMKNRILNLLTRPIEEREPFLEVNNGKPMIQIIRATDNEQVLKSAFCDGARYELIEFKLPKKSTVRRKDIGLLEIDTPMVNIQFNVVYKGLNTYIPSLFFKLYLNNLDKKEIDSFSISIHCRIKMKIRSLLPGKGIKYHSWIDSFLRSLDEKINKDKFFDRIEWQKIEAMYIAFGQNKINPTRQKHEGEKNNE
ncbi:hypothetical protein H1S01_17830 [Heliobacterium chlorum]|uniref:Uncharacterized protein n=1 Tax=Heliobacterium chlorum TaxID=2698 RepID=A0ABR7T868_HELCL|nr:hypothetical protein [Heliobacterium chlorum]MBC9786322.1 hypothetical protein [Heliobacterium chlorum]